MTKLEKLREAYDASLANSSEAYLVYVATDAAANKIYMASLDVVDSAADAYYTAYRAYIKSQKETTSE